MKKIFPFIMVSLLFIVACSVDSVSPPVNQSPVSKYGKPIRNTETPIIDLQLFEDNSLEALGIMGCYELKINGDTFNAELISKRINTLGESWIISGTSFFTMWPCSTCLSIKSIWLTSDGYLQVNFNIKHPFPAGNSTKPPSALNRLDLDIFDLALIIHPLNFTSTYYPLTNINAYTGIVAKNAGYTRELAFLTEDNAAMPYILVIDDNSRGTNTWNKFAMGTEFTDFSVFFNLKSGTTLIFDLYLTMGYGASAKGRANRLNPTYFNPEFNRKAAWKVNVIPPQGDNPPSWLNTWNDDDKITKYNVRVEVFDWQHGNSNIANPPVNPTDIAFPSDVASVSVEILGMTNSLVTVTIPESGTGTPSDPLIYIIPVANENLLDAGEYVGLVKVTDQRVPQPIPPHGSIDYLIDCPDKGTLVNYAIPEFATYQTFIATVVIGNQPPTCDLHLSATSGDMNSIIQADPGSSSDPEGLIASYEYDFHYDGFIFRADKVQYAGSPDFGNPVDIVLPCNNTSNPITTTIALRVCDSGAQPLCEICTKDVQISTKMSGNIGNLKVSFINRGEGGADAELVTSIDLDWNDFPCAVEYSIERADGMNPTDWTEVGISTTSDFKYVLSDATMDWDQDYRFRVVAHAIAGGNPGNDSSPSEEVFVLFVTGLGYYTNNNWTQHRELTAYFFPSMFIYPGIDGKGYGMACITFVGNPAAINCWAVYRSPAIPDIVGQTEAFCDGYIETWQTSASNPMSSTSGMCIGTLSAIPNNYTTALYDFEPANEIYDPSSFAYNQFDVMGLNQEFGEINQAGWANLHPTWRHVSYYLNDLLDNSRDYIALGAANGDQVTNLTSTVYWRTDAWVFVVQ